MLKSVHCVNAFFYQLCVGEKQIFPFLGQVHFLSCTTCLLMGERISSLLCVDSHTRSYVVSKLVTINCFIFP